MAEPDRSGRRPRWVRRVGIGLVSVALVFVVIGLLLPSTYLVSRSVVIQADPEDIHEFVGDLRQWERWGPWKEEDPTLTVTYGNKTSGVGASQSWAGQDGTGSLRFTASSPRRGVRYDLSFDDGAYQCRAALRYHSEEDQTRVFWMMRGEMETPVLGGYVALLMDPLVGRVFERGLARLKQVVEEQAARDA